MSSPTPNLLILYREDCGAKSTNHQVRPNPPTVGLHADPPSPLMAVHLAGPPTHGPPLDRPTPAPSSGPQHPPRSADPRTSSSPQSLARNLPSTFHPNGAFTPHRPSTSLTGTSSRPVPLRSSNCPCLRCPLDSTPLNPAKRFDLLRDLPPVHPIAHLE